jgi:hypothetical protein
MSDQLAAALIGLVAGALSGFLAAAVTNQFERRRVIDDAVRDVRRRRYAELWRATSLFPKWPRATVTTAEVVELSVTFRNWYFGSGSDGPAELSRGEEDADPGGMYLSQDAQLAYTAVQDSLGGIVNQSSQDDERELSVAEYDRVREACSALRTELTDDLLSRKRAFLVS